MVTGERESPPNGAAPAPPQLAEMSTRVSHAAMQEQRHILLNTRKLQSSFCAPDPEAPTCAILVAARFDRPCTGLLQSLNCRLLQGNRPELLFCPWKNSSP